MHGENSENHSRKSHQGLSRAKQDAIRARLKQFNEEIAKRRQARSETPITHQDRLNM
jgi:hypothetical protein